MAVIDLKKATITIQDADGSNSIEIKIGEGNLVYTEKRNMEYLKDKGSLDTVREGDEEPMDVRFEFQWEYIIGSTTTGDYPSVEDALKGIGAAQDWVSSSPDLCEPFAVDIKIVYDPTTGNANCTGAVETIILPDFRYENLEHDLRAGQISCTGMCNATQATVTQAAAS